MRNVPRDFGGRAAAADDEVEEEEGAADKVRAPRSLSFPLPLASRSLLSLLSLLSLPRMREGGPFANTVSIFLPTSYG